MERETKHCIRCGNVVEIVPAGTSKKTGKEYGSFAPCDAKKGGCGFSEQIGVQPRQLDRPLTPQPAGGAEKILKRLDGIDEVLEIILLTLRGFISKLEYEEVEAARKELEKTPLD